MPTELLDPATADAATTQTVSDAAVAPIKMQDDPLYEAFAKVVPEDKPQPQTPQRGADGKFIKQPSDDNAEPQSTDAAESQQDEPAPTFKLTEAAKKYAGELKIESDEDAAARAFSAYERDGIFAEAELVERYKANPDLFVELGLKRAKVQADNDAFSRAHKELLKKVNGDGKPAAEDNGQKQEPVPLDKALEAEIAKLTQGIPIVDEDGTVAYVSGEAMRTHFSTGLTSVAKLLASQHAKEVGELQQKFATDLAKQDADQQALWEAFFSREVEDERRTLLPEYPDLNKPETQSKVQEKYQQLRATGEYQTAAEAYGDAVVRVLGKTKNNNMMQRILAAAKAKKAAVPHNPVASTVNTPAKQDDLRRTFDEYAQRFGVTWE